ncbi:MAG: hypothetical protein IBJ10_08390 [Phycisphaerales bacterium]|nr:hypothetical protein [Phycisphaerales bacterium]
MKRFPIWGGLAALAFAAGAGAAQLNIADAGVGSSHNPDGTGGSGNIRGGLFRVTINNTTGLPASSIGGDIVAGKVFLTFCIEIGENINFGNNYNFAVNVESINGGASPNNPQPLMNQTAYLYSAFRAGTLTTAFDITSNADVNALQDAIWFFQNQLGAADVDDNANLIDGVAGNGELSAKAIAFVNEANAAGWTTIRNVRVLNVGAAGSYNNQDLIAIIPLPQGVGLASAGLLVLGARRRRSL